MSTAGHPDPCDPNVPRLRPSDWGPLRRAAFGSRQMEAFREGLRLPGIPDIRTAVLDDLSTYFKIDADEALHHATNSFELGAAEWNARERTTTADISDFYVNVKSWLYGQLWYAYLQAEGYASPVATMIAADLGEHPPATLLDFGSGCGAGAMMFANLGYEVSLADVSTPLLDFARFRFERRGLAGTFIDLNTATLPERSYDAITAIQTLAHVPDIRATGTQLHGALRPPGVLYADIDARPRDEGDSRLYDDDLGPRRALRSAGFVEVRSVEGLTVRYHRVPASGPAHECRRLRDTVVLGPPRKIWRQFRYR